MTEFQRARNAVLAILVGVDATIRPSSSPRIIDEIVHAVARELVTPLEDQLAHLKDQVQFMERRMSAREP